jgi:hypothetical protein
MNVGNEQLVEEAVAGLLRAARANDAEAAPARHSRQTDQCPNIARFAAVFKCGAKWTPEERAHTLGCGFCLDVMKTFTTAAAINAQEDTVAGLDTSNDTHVGGPPKSGKKRKGSGPGDPPKPGAE